MPMAEASEPISAHAPSWPLCSARSARAAFCRLRIGSSPPLSSSVRTPASPSLHCEQRRDGGRARGRRRARDERSARVQAVVALWRERVVRGGAAALPPRCARVRQPHSVREDEGGRVLLAVKLRLGDVEGHGLGGEVVERRELQPAAALRRRGSLRARPGEEVHVLVLRGHEPA